MAETASEGNTTAATGNFFRKMWGAGYRDLLPIVPPGAPISPNSSLARRPQAIGKVPGVRGLDGRWSSYKWTAQEPDEGELDRWHDMGAGVGVRGERVPGLDFDVLNADVCAALQAIAVRMLGETSVRVGLAPKVLLPYRAETPLRWRRIAFTLPGDTRTHGVELIGIDRQWVAVGVHPVTGRPYDWTNGLRPYSALPLLTEDGIDAFFAEAQTALLDTGATLQTVIGTTAADRAEIDQDALRGPLAAVQAAIRAIPNTNELFATRAEYVRMGIAIKAALADHPDEAEAAWVEWAMRWEGNDANPQGNSEDEVRADWSRMHPPFSMGASWIFETARPYGFSDAALDFENITTPIKEPEAWGIDDIVQNAHRLREMRGRDAGGYDALRCRWDNYAGMPAKVLDALEQWGAGGGVPPALAGGADLDFFSVGDLSEDPPPPRQWVWDGLIPAGEVVLLYGAGGVGKTLIVGQLGVYRALGAPLYGAPVRQGRTLALLFEDSKDEVHSRLISACRGLGTTVRAIGRQFEILPRDASERPEGWLLATFDRDGSMKLTGLWHDVLGKARAMGADLIVIDTLAQVFGGNENDRAQVTRFVSGCLGRLGREAGATILMLAHPSKATQHTHNPDSGSTAWNGSVRARLSLDWDQTNSQAGGLTDFRKLVVHKSNYGKAGVEIRLKWHENAFISASDPEAAATVAEQDAAAEAALLAGLSELTEVKQPTSASARASTYLPRLVAKRTEAGRGVSVDALEAAMNRLFQRRALASEQALGWRKLDRKPAVGIARVSAAQCGSGPGNSAQEAGAHLVEVGAE